LLLSISTSYCALVLPEPPPTGIDHALGRLPSLLTEDLEDQDRIRIHAADDTPGLVFVRDSKLQAARSDRAHGPGVWHSEAFAALKPPKQNAGFHPRGIGERAAS